MHGQEAFILKKDLLLQMQNYLIMALVTILQVILVVVFSATVAVRADGEGLLPITTVCLV
jgi:hypothetical protein